MIRRNSLNFYRPILFRLEYTSMLKVAFRVICVCTMTKYLSKVLFTGNNVTTIDIVDKVESVYVSNVKTAAKDDYDGISGDVSPRIALCKSCLL